MQHANTNLEAKNVSVAKAEYLLTPAKHQEPDLQQVTETEFFLNIYSRVTVEILCLCAHYFCVGVWDCSLKYILLQIYYYIDILDVVTW